jgi:AbiV family abortive infection protein
MTTEDFNKIPKEDLLIAAKETEKNARSLFNVAQNTASSKGFGIANSLMILAAEECVKSAILTAGYFNVELPFDIKPFFSDHKTKHSQAAEIQPAVNFIWGIRDAYVKALKNRKSNYGAFFEIAFVNVIALIVSQISSKPVGDFSAWWKTANIQKNDGFYVGYYNGKWNFPSGITNEIYTQTLTIVQPFVECLQIINEIRPGDNLLFSKEKKFTDEEIETSGFKLTPVNPETSPDINFDDYKSSSK